MLRRPRPSLVLAPLIAALACAAAALPTVTPPDPEANVVADLVVRAPSGGPAWWKVTSGVGTVWVLGTPSALPKGLGWDDVALDRRLSRANRVILPPTARFGVFDLFGALSLSGKLHGKPFEAALPPDLAQRFSAAASTLRQAPGHYDHWKPAVAGLLMVADFRKQAGLDANQPLNAIKGAAGRHHLKASPAATYPAIPIARRLAGELSSPVNLACLADALQEIEVGAGRVRTAAQAWAIGDVGGALSAERGYERCLAALPDGADLVRQGEADQASAIAQALKTPGVVVAVVELRPLLAQGGVLDRLLAAGYQVRPPGAE
jgi:hypothetical protein